jgi:predicted XRE-type DNA-binding protein
MNFPYQDELRLMGEVRQPRPDEIETIERLPSFRAALRHAISLSGLLQEEVAKALEIDKGEFSRMVNERSSRARSFPADKLGAFARITGTMVVQQWLADQIGQEVICKRESKVQRLERQLAEARAASPRPAHAERQRAYA